MFNPHYHLQNYNDDEGDENDNKEDSSSVITLSMRWQAAKFYMIISNSEKKD